MDLSNLVTLFVFICLQADTVKPSAQFWRDTVLRALDKRLQLVGGSRPSQVAKNVILFIGDGMGPSTVTAARVLKSQREHPNRGGETVDTPLVFEDFLDIALTKTYNTDKTVPDSAATATAYLCGIKTRYNVLGLSDAVPYQDCGQQLQEINVTTCIGDWAARAGKSVGVITTTEATHATPGPMYAHAASRKWQADNSLPEEAKQLGCRDIARQFVEDFPGTSINVLMGGGLHKFTPTSSGGERLDGRNLMDEWKQAKQNQGQQYKFVNSKSQLEDVSGSDTDYLLGLFPFDDYYQYPQKTETNVPTLAEMVQAAIPILQKNENGFFLLVEAGTIDWGHHHNLALRALDDVLALEAAVIEAMKMTSRAGRSSEGVVQLDDTLIVVTADHSHPFVMAGYPPREQNILEAVRDENEPNKIQLASDGLPYTSFMYGGGMGYAIDESGQRLNVSAHNTTSEFYRFPSSVRLEDGPHGGEDVAVYAVGAMSHLFGGVQEQNYIAHAMAAASCMDGHSHRDHCQNSGSLAPALKTTSAVTRS